MRGGDILGPFLRYARAAGMKGFVTWRMNDAQAFAQYKNRPLEDQFKVSAPEQVSLRWVRPVYIESTAPGPVQSFFLA